MVSKYDFAAARSDDFEMILANQIFELLELRPVGHKIKALRSEPKTLESRVVNEYVPSARCVGAILEIEVTPIQDQNVPIYIKRYGRQSPVIMVHDQLSLRRLQQRFRKGPRRQKGIEHHHRQPCGMVKQNHHQRLCQERTQINPSESRKGASQQRDRCDRQRQAQISKRVKSKVHHVAEGEGIGAGMVAERGRDVTRCWDVSHQEK